MALSKKKISANQSLDQRKSELLTIQQVADQLGVSTKTLRRWEDKGFIKADRTGGNQRRYSASHLKDLQQRIKKPAASSPSQVSKAIDDIPVFVPTAHLPIETSNNVPDALDTFDTPHTFDTRNPSRLPFPLGLKTASIVLGVVCVGIIGAIALDNGNLPLIAGMLGKGSQTDQTVAEKLENIKLSDVLADTIKIKGLDGQITFNIDAFIDGNATVSGTLTAPNITYRVLPGQNITVSGDPQNPTISTGPIVSSLGGESGDLELAAGTGITINDLEISLTNNSVTVTAGSGLSGGGPVPLGGTVTLTNAGVTALTAGEGIALSGSTGSVTISATSPSGIITVEESDATVTSTASTLDFLGGDFDVTESPSGEANVQLAATLTSVTGVAGNFDIAGTLTSGTGNAFSVSTTGGITIPSGQTLTIGTIGLSAVGASSVTSGASLIGVFDEFTNSSSTNIQDVLDDFDTAIGGGASKWTQDTGFIYLTNTTDAVTIGGTTQLGKLAVDGDADEIQLLIQGNATQTAHLAVFENSSGTDLFRINNAGQIISGSSLITLTTATGALDADSIGLISSDGTGGTGSGSGLETDTDRLGLLQGCTDGQVLKWNNTSNLWECANDTGATSAVVNVENNDVAVGTNVDTLDFSTDFSVTASPSNEANISVADDILNFTEFSDTLTLDAATTITNSLSGNLIIDLTSTGDFVISDAGSPFATFTDGGVFTLDSLNLDGTTIGLTTDTDLLSLANNALTVNGSLTATGALSASNFSGSSSGTNTGDQNVFNKFAVATQSDVDADSTSDTLTLAAGSGVTITTTAGTDTITISATGTGGDITAVGNITSGDAFTSGVPGAELYFADNGFLGLGAAAGRIEFDDQTTDEVNILGANVGIGTTTPIFKIDTGVTADNMRIGRAEIGAWPLVTTFAYFGNEALDHGVAGNYALLQDTSGATFLNAAATQPIRFRIGNNDKMIIDSAGNVGVGDTSPSSLLEVGDGTDSLQISSVGDITFVDADGGASITGPAGGALAINAALTGLNLQADGTIDVNLAGGSGATGCTVANTTGNFTCTGALSGSNFSGSSTGTNTGDQNVFTTFAVATQSNVVSDVASDTLTLAAGSGVTIATDASTDTITISATGTGGDITAVGDVTTGDAFSGTAGNTLQFEGATPDGFEISLTAADPGADFTITLPALTGTICISGDTCATSGTVGYWSRTGTTLSPSTVGDSVSITGNTTIGDASGDTLTANAASWTFANDTNFVLSGGINGLSFDTDTLSIDATNNRVGFGVTSMNNRIGIADHTTAAGGIGFGTDVELYRSAANRLSLGNSDDLAMEGIVIVTSGRLFRADNATNASNPGYAFNNDTNTGMFQAGADTLAFTTNGTERARFDSSGNFGIGTTSPAALLSVGTTSASNFKVNADGDVTSSFTTLDGSSTANGAGSSSTTLIVVSGTNFDVGNYVNVVSTNCVTGVNSCYAKITAKATNTLTISPALTWANGSTVTEVHVPEIGGTDLTRTLINRYGRGYFIDGIVTGNGSTYYTDNAIYQDDPGSTFNLLSDGNTTTINLGTSASTINVSGTFNATSTAPAVFSGDININKADPTLIYNVSTASDTDFWAGVQDDAGGDDDDLYQIGKGTTPGTTPYFTINQSGNVGIGTANPSVLLTLGSSVADSDLLALTPNATGANTFTGTITSVDLTAARTWTFPNTTGSICIAEAGNCAGSGSGVTTPGGTANRLAKFTGAQTIGDAGISDTSDALAITIDSSENVGIGDTSPLYLLTVGSGDLFGVNSSGNIVWEGSSADTSETILTVVNPTADITYRLADAAAGTYDLCSTANNCSGTSTVALSSITAATTTNTINSANFAQTWNWNSLATETGFTFGTSSTALTSGGLLSIAGTGAPAASWTGDLAKIEYNNADVDVDGNALKVGILGAAAGDGTALNITTAQTGSSALALRINDDGTYTDSTPFAVTAAGDVGIGITNPSYKLDVQGTLGVVGTLGTISTSGTGNNLDFSRAGSNYITATNASGTLQFGSGGNQGQVLITTTGNVGINTGGPDRKLEILDTASPQLRLTHTDNTFFADLQTPSTGGLSLTTNSLTTSGAYGLQGVFTVAGTAASQTYYGNKLAVTNNQTTNANTLYGQHISFTDAGSLANTVTGLYVDATTANSADTTYAAVFQGGNVGIGDNSPSSKLEIGDGTDSLQISSVGDLTFVDADGGASITGPAGGTLTLAAGASQDLSLTAADDILFDDLQLSSALNLTVADTAINGALTQGIVDAINDLYDLGTGGGGASIWSRTSAVIHPTTATDDLAIGGSTVLASMFGIDESAGNFYFGYDNSANPTLNFEATDADAGEFGFNTNDAFFFSNANVGIGTTAPTSHLEIDGNITAAAWGLEGKAFDVDAATFTDSSTAGSGTATNAAINSFGIPTLAASNTSVTTTNAYTMFIAGSPVAGTNQTITNSYALGIPATGSSSLGFSVLGTGNTGIWSPGSSANILSVGTTGYINFNSSTGVNGIFARPVNIGTGDVVGVSAQPVTSNPGTTGNLVGLQAAIRSAGGGGAIITNGKMFEASSPTISSGTITNQYGLYINQQKLSGVTTGYGVYQVDSGDLNYFAGNVGIGDTTPAYLLTVGNGDLFGIDSSSNTQLTWEGSSADANETILTVVNPTADLIYRLADAAAGTYDLCSTANNCSGSSTVPLSSITAATTTNTINSANFAQVWNWNSLATETGFTFGTSSTALTSGGLFSIAGTGAPAASWTGDLAKIEYNNADVDVDGNALKVGLLGVAAGEGTALNITTAQTGTNAYALRVNDDGTYTDSSPFVVDVSGNVGIGTTAPGAQLSTLLPTGSGTYAAFGRNSTLDVLDLFSDAGGNNFIRSGFGDLAFSTVAGANAASATEKMRITTAGNVGIGDTTPSSRLEVGDGTDSLQISSVGDLLFVDADGSSSITGPAGGALAIAAANSQALNLTTTTAGNISLDPAGAGDITLVTSSGAGSNLNISGLGSGSGSTLCLDGSSNVVTCAAGSGGITVRETDGSPSVSTSTLEFGPATTSSDEFIISDQGSGVARVRIGDQVGILNQAETVTGGWTFGTGATIFNSGATFNTDVDLTFADTENINLTSTVTGTNAVDLFSTTLTNQTTSGTQRGIVVTNANDAANATTESLILLDNAETTAATLTDALRITSSGVNGGIVDGIDVSDGNIDNAINIGANAIAGTNFNVSGAGAVVAVGVNSGSGQLSGTGGLTLTGTTLINNSGTANTTIGNSAGGTITIGASSGSDLVLNDAQWSITGAGAATFATVTVGGDTIDEFVGTGLQLVSGDLQTTLGTDVDLASAEVTGILTMNKGGTNKNMTASNGQVAYSDADSLELTTGGNTGECLTYNSGAAPTWTACTTASSSPFSATGGVITKVTASDRLSLRYGDAGDTQLEVENTTSGTIPTADAASINLTGGTTGIVTDGADALFIAAEFGNGITNTNSGIHIDIDPVNTPSGDEIFYGINIDGLAAGTAATETAINIGTNWDNYLNTSTIDITGAGAITGATGITSSGTITFSGLTADRLVATTTGGQLTNSISSANTALSVSDETGSGLLVFGTSPTISTSLLTDSSSFDLLNTTATTINLGGAATDINVGVTGATAGTFDILGGSGATGCTVQGSNGNLTCDGLITGSNISGTNTGDQTLQTAYDADANGSDTIIALSANDDSLIFRNPASGGTDSAFVLTLDNLETGDTTNNFKNLNVTQAGSYDTTAGNITNYGGYFSNTSTESAGGNVLTNVGLYATATGGNTNYAAIFEAGNVGIGTTAPGNALTINNGNLALGGIKLPTSSTITFNTPATTVDYSNYALYGDTTTTALNTPASGNLSFRVANSEKMVILSGGNVGIGDTSPDAFLEVLGTTEQLRLTHTDGTKDVRFTVDTSGNLTLDSSTDGTGSQTLALTGFNTLSSDATTFNLLNTTATTINFGGAATDINVGVTGTTAGTFDILGGSTDTGCTVQGSNGNLTCSGAIATTATTGTQGWWSRTGTTLSPANSGDAVTTSGNISTTSTGTITSAGTLTASNGLTLTTGALSLTGTSGSIALTGFGTTSITSTTATGNINTLADSSFAVAAAATGNLLNLTFTNGSTNSSGTSITTGLNLAPTISTALTSTGVADTYGIRIQDAAGTITAGGTPNIYGMRIGNQGRTNAVTSYGLFIDSPTGSTNNYALVTSGAARVGIGITAPTELLDVAGNIGVSGNIIDTGGANASIQLSGTSTGRFTRFLTSATGSSIYGFGSSSDSLNLGAGSNDHLSIISGGNIGIGDTGPDAKLEVLSTTEQLRLTHTDDTKDVRFTVDTSGNLTLDSSTDGTGSQTLALTGFTTLSGSGALSLTAVGALTLSPTGAGNDLIANLVDNNTDALDIQQGTDNYININTTDSSEAMTLGNSLTNFSLTLDKGASGNIILSDFANCTLTTVSNNLTCGAGGTGDITAVGNITSGDAFTSGTPGAELYFADNGFLGLGGAAGRIEFDDQTTDEINFLAANVGIGTSTPLHDLHVFPAADEGSISIQAVDGSPSTLYFGDTGSSQVAALYRPASTEDLRILFDGVGDVVTFKDDGKVGFGDASPDAQFDIDSLETTGNVEGILANALTTGAVLEINSTHAATNGSDNEALDFNFTYTPTTTAGTFRGLDLNLSEGSNALANTLYGLKLTTSNANNTSTGTHTIYGGHFTATGKTAGTTTAVGLYATAAGADNNYAAIFEAGNVGIGTTSPSALLHVSTATADDTIAKFYYPAAADNQSVSMQLGKSLSTNEGATLEFHYDTTATDRFINLRFNGATGITMNTSSNLGIGDTTPTEAKLVVGAAGAGDIFLTLATAGTTNDAVCWDNAGATLLYDCDGTPADYAESYPVETGTTYGEIMMTSTEMITTTVGTRVPKLVKAVAGGTGSVIGITSDNYHDFTSAGKDEINPSDNPMPVALNGRVIVKIAADSQAIAVGDYLTVSSTPGRGTKATQAGQMIGKALEAWSPNSEADTIMVFVTTSYADPNNLLANLTLDDSGNLILPNTDPEEEVTALGGEPAPAPKKDLAWTLGDIVRRLTQLEDKIGEGTTGTTGTTSTTSTDSARLDALSTRTDILSENLSNLESDLSTLNSQLSTRIASLEADLALFASGSALLTPEASNSASLTSHFSSLTSEDANIFGTLSVGGRTTLSDVGITGKMNIGLLVIEGLSENGFATLNTTSGDLKIQSDGLNGVDILDGKIVIEPNGNMKVNGTVTVKKLNVDTSEVAGASIGEGIIPAGDTKVTIGTSSVTAKSKIFITPKSKTSLPLSVTTQTAGDSFKVEINAPAATDIKFSWFIVN